MRHPSAAQEWIAADARNAEVLFPYLNGEDLNSRPDTSASRWVIDFNDRDEAQAAKYPLLYARVLQQVRPERDKLLGRNPTANDRAKNWWKFGRRSPAMRKAIAELPEVLVIALVSKTVMPMRVSTAQVFSHMLGVFALDGYSAQAVLSSSLHQTWAITYGSTLETRVRYTPSDVFETFPLPVQTDRLDTVGRSLDTERREVMFRRDLGLTKLYNLVNNPEIQRDKEVDRLREIHVEIDEATVAAYGWDSDRLSHGFYTYRQMQRWTLSPTARIETLDRLLLENHRRADTGPNSRTSAKGHDAPSDERTLFD
jgi:hypothetical protein